MMEDFGKTAKGIPVKRITIRPKLPEKLTSGSDGEVWSGVRAVFINYGAVLQQLWIPGHTDTGGKKKTPLTLADVVLGYPDIGSYEKNVPYHGAIVGRVAGRISNARFAIPYELDPTMTGVYRLPKNLKKQHCLHAEGLDRKPGTPKWSQMPYHSIVEELDRKSDSLKRCQMPYHSAIALTSANLFQRLVVPEARRKGGLFDPFVRLAVVSAISQRIGLSNRPWEIAEQKPESVKFKIFSPDGEDGFPGNLTVYVTYRIVVNSEEKIELSIDYFASVTDAICPLNLTNHTYFNLAGHRAGPEALDRHVACIAADRILETEPDLMPTGRILKAGKVDGTDLRKPVGLKDGLRKIHPAPFQGFDDYYIFNQMPEEEAKMTVSEPNSGRRVEVFSDQPGVQFYTGNCLEPKTDPVGKDGYSYPPHSGFCMELQGFPDAVNRANFPKTFVLPNGKPYIQKTKFVFSF
ncbi:hypothetical protein AAHC03_0210 [Spirometra sp. Aus1]